MKRPLLLQAFEGNNEQVPIWFMRQAGRYLPEYQKIKEHHSLDEMFKTPEIASEITLLPIDILNVDAAILFADILTLPSLLGVELHFDNTKGPVIKGGQDLNILKDIKDIGHIDTTIQLTKDKLSKETALIGFAGSPFTVLTYFIEGGSSLNLRKTLQFIQCHEKTYHQWMAKLTKNTITYLKGQVQAGVDVIQLFDTWAGQLRASDYARWVLPYVQEIFDALSTPSIYYVKNCNHLLSLMDKTSADFLSVCHTVVLGHHSVIDKTKKGIQGNLNNGLLYADEKTLEKEVHDVLIGALKHDRYIFNLSHGVFPDTNVATLQEIVRQVHRFSWK